MSDKLPGKGWFGWLGRQIGYVSKAVRTEPLATPPAAKPSAAQRAERDEPAKTEPPPAEPAGAVLYRQGQVQEAEHPSQPGAYRVDGPDHFGADGRIGRAGGR